MSRRQRCAKRKAVRARVSQAKVLRRRARGARATRAATAAAAAVTLAGVAASGGYPTPSARAETLQEAARTAASLARCPDQVTNSSVPSAFVEVGETVFFTADDGIHGDELWKTDGTKAGTVLVKDIKPGTFYDSYYHATYPSSSGPSNLTAVGGSSTSPPKTASTATSCGSRTAPRPAPSWSKTSTAIGQTPTRTH